MGEAPKQKNPSKEEIIRKATILWGLILQTPGATALAGPILKRQEFDDLSPENRVTVAVILTAYERGVNGKPKAQTVPSESTGAAEVPEDAQAPIKAAEEKPAEVVTPDEVIDPRPTAT